MARKLKSDPVLFVATVGLVCLSIVMVWSASAVVAMERYQQPYLFVRDHAGGLLCSPASHALSACPDRQF